VRVEIYEGGFGENMVDPCGAGDLRIFVCINAYQNRIVLGLPFVD